MMEIRPEEPEDVAAVRWVNQVAFGRTGEADLVDVLRAEGAIRVSLVAETEDGIVGHILFSPVDVVPPDGGEATGFKAVALGPMAVLPRFQAKGIGSQLIRAGLEACRQMGETVVFVLGHSDYYPRFGFHSSRRYGITSQFDVPPEIFMLLELEEGVLAGRQGTVVYHPAFTSV